MDISNYEQIRQSTESYYHRIGKLISPALGGEFIHFTSEGFNHLVFKSSRTERAKADQIAKFKLLPRAVELVRIATTYQEYEESLKDFDVKRHKRRVREARIVRYWGLIGIIQDRKVKVVIRQIAGGQKHFWSVIPNWVTNQYRDTRFPSSMKGDPETD